MVRLAPGAAGAAVPRRLGVGVVGAQNDAPASGAEAGVTAEEVAAAEQVRRAEPVKLAFERDQERIRDALRNLPRTIFILLLAALGPATGSLGPVFRGSDGAPPSAAGVATAASLNEAMPRSPLWKPGLHVLLAALASQLGLAFDDQRLPQLSEVLEERAAVHVYVPSSL